MINLITKYWTKKYFINEIQTGGGEKKWTTLSFNGLLFPPLYKPHKIPLVYDGKEIILNPLAEEYATYYAKYTGTEYIKISKFTKNFWKGWSKLLKNEEITNFEKCDFSKIYEHILANKEKRTDLSNDKYKIALIDGKEQQVGNYRVEPPGLFIGRGCHPKIGSLKKRVYPEDITLNIGKESQIPIPDIPGDQTTYKWGKIIHDNTVEWLASWKDTITNKTKYVWLSSHSDMKKNNDKEKFEMARKLKQKIKSIRAKYENDIINGDEKQRQIATAIYLIDNLALRVGNEKYEDEADTVGVTSLRLEHIKLKEGVVRFDFLGKDSIRYKKDFVPIKEVYNNIEKFMENKNSENELFNLINSNDINKYLQTCMKGLTAKIFRTYNASELLYKELHKLSKKYENNDKDDMINILLDGFNSANAKVAMMCNHQKNISKSFHTQVNKLIDRMKTIKQKINKAKPQQKKKLKQQLTKLKIKKALKIELKNISLGTSKVNYIDPRISVAFLKKHNIPLEKIFSKTLQEKFSWAFDVDSSFQF